MAGADEEIKVVIATTLLDAGLKQYNAQLKQAEKNLARVNKRIKEQHEAKFAPRRAAGMASAVMPAAMRASRAAERARTKAPFTSPIGGMMPPLRGIGSPVEQAAASHAMSVLPNPSGNWNKQTSAIDWVGDGDKRFIPAPKKAPAQTKGQERFTKMGNTLKKVNMSLFKLQMASLGVFFSFMSIQQSITGLFTGLQNIGGAFKSMALGKAFGGVDILGNMGVDPATMVQGWKNITGIMGMMQTTMTGIAAVALSPEVMTAIQEMFTSLSTSLSDGKVAKAIGDIIIAFTDLVILMVESGFLSAVADLVSALGDSGLLMWIIALVLGAKYLLAALSLLGFAMQGITLALSVLSPLWTILTSILAATGVSFGFLLGVIALVLIAIDFVINFFENLAATGDILGSVVAALWDTFADLYNVLLPLMNLIGGFLGMEQRAAFETNSGRNTQIQNNYNFNGNYDDTGALMNNTRKNASRSY